MRILMAVAVLIAGCGDPTGPKIPPPESPLFDVSVAGKWKAEQINIFFGVTFDLTEHRPDSITGTWAGFTQCASYLAGASPLCNARSGLVTSGRRSGGAVTLAMDSGNLPCGYGQVIEVTRSGNTATGTAKPVWCAGGIGHYAMPVTLRRE